MRKSVFWCIFCTIICPITYPNAQAQQLRKIEWADILNEWVTSEDTMLTFSNLHILPSSRKSRYSELPKDSSGRTIIDKKIIFNTVKMEEFISFDESFTKGLIFDKCAIDYLAIINSHFNFFEFWGKSTSFQFEKNIVENRSGIILAGASGLSTAQEAPASMFILNNQFSDFYLSSNFGIYDLLLNDNTFINFYFGVNGRVEAGASFRRNTFRNPENNGRVIISLNTENFIFNDNTLESDFVMDHCALTSQMDFEGNTFNKSVSFTRVAFPEHFNNISWRQLDGRKLAIRTDENPQIRSDEPLPEEEINQIPYVTLYKPEKQSDFDDEISYNSLISLYTRLYTIFRNNGNIISSNGCYAEMKEIEGQKFQSLYENQPTFKNYFRWKLNQLMKTYTNHGTDPALAIVISMYVLMAFAVFYFFFPSEWDVSSKSKLIQNFKDFIQENDKGYAKPFMMMMLGFGISIVNALTLSLNSFTTLGFGTIPTKGLARYVCIIQGFIGWFLLSIFTVALINQVLA